MTTRQLICATVAGSPSVALAYRSAFDPAYDICLVMET